VRCELRDLVPPELEQDLDQLLAERLAAERGCLEPIERAVERGRQRLERPVLVRVAGDGRPDVARPRSAAARGSAGSRFTSN
jgi:hypothetical protein